MAPDGGKSLLYFFERCSFAMPTVPCLGTTTLPCLPEDIHGFRPVKICQCPSWVRSSPCLAGALASCLPGNVCQCASPAWACLKSLPGTLASSLPGKVCQCPTWERLPPAAAWGSLPVPCRAHFAVSACEALPVPCLETFTNDMPGHVY